MSSLFRKGRLAAPDPSLVEFASSIEQDRRIANAAVLINEAHVVALVKSGIVDRDEGRKLALVLRRLEKNPPFRRAVEDIHVLIEEEVARKLGVQTGGKLHTGKSRNGQVATAIRVVLREALLRLSCQVLSLELELLRLSGNHRKSLFVGYTHLQPAQPITFAHYLLAIGDSLLRDNQRIMEALRRVDLSPMGAGALAGSSFRIDRHLIARLLGFRGIVENSLDAVGGRDFLLETLGVFTVLALDLSRICQDLVFYSSADVALVDLPDRFSSTSSIMPQKKNPDILEIVRARCAQVVGNFSTATTTLHALPTGYNLDFQELTPLLWNSLDTLGSCLKVLTSLVQELRLTGRTLGPQVQLTAATEVANVLVREGKLPFREAHRRVGRAVRMAVAKQCSLQDLDRGDWEGLLAMSMSPGLLREIRDATDLESHIESYRTRGSPNPSETARMISLRERETSLSLRNNKKVQKAISAAFQRLHKTMVAF